MVTVVLFKSKSEVALSMFYTIPLCGPHFVMMVILFGPQQDVIIDHTFLE
jgi:hypothetical protein